MAERRKRLKRIIRWCGVTTLLFVLHIASGPYVLYVLRHGGILARNRFLTNVYRVVYAPGIYLYDHPESPGHDAYVSYCEWSVKQLDRLREGKNSN